MSDSYTKRNLHFSVLFVGDPHLGERGLRIVCRRFANTTGVIWKRGDARRREDIRTLLRSQKWDLLISFYNDLIFQEADLAQVSLPLNIHPSLPALRGVGYDMLPLIEDHKRYGATLHYMIREVDAGKIVDVLEEDLPLGITYRQFRPLTQSLCLKLLTKTVQHLSNFQDIRDFYQLIALETRHQKVEWSSPRCSTEKLTKLLDVLRKKDPTHRVFR